MEVGPSKYQVLILTEDKKWEKIVIKIKLIKQI